MVGSGQPGVEVPIGSRVGKIVDPQNDLAASCVLTAVSSYSEGVLFTGEAFVQKAVLLLSLGGFAGPSLGEPGKSHGPRWTDRRHDRYFTDHDSTRPARLHPL